MNGEREIRVIQRPEGALIENGVNVSRGMHSTYVYIADGMETTGTGHFICVYIPDVNPKDYSLREQWEDGRERWSFTPSNSTVPK